jgi:hypothetical protein
VINLPSPPQPSQQPPRLRQPPSQPQPQQPLQQAVQQGDAANTSQEEDQGPNGPDNEAPQSARRRWQIESHFGT